MPGHLVENLRLGCPVWAHTPWIGKFFTSDARRSDYLQQYGSVFNAVEGNSSFYGLPSKAIVERWCREAPDGFEFCFKFPRVVSHDLMLRNAGWETLRFIDRVRPLGKNLGPFFLQLPPQFGPPHLPNLAMFLGNLPGDFSYCVEVRDVRFFDDPDMDIALNKLLEGFGMNRVVFDTRALFAAPSGDEATEAAQRRKPRLPVRKVATADRPFVRFVGHPDAMVTDPMLREWVDPVIQWLGEGKTPYFFTHMPDDTDGPALGRRFLELLIEAGLDAVLPDWPCQTEIPPAKQMDLFSL